MQSKNLLIACKGNADHILFLLHKKKTIRLREWSYDPGLSC